MICPNCFGENLSTVTINKTIPAPDGTELTFGEELTNCGACGERFHSHEQAMALSRARAGALRAHAGLLTPDEIRGIREQYGITQDALERMLRVGPKTVVRWERGTVCQSPGIDTLLTVIRDQPSAAAQIANRAGVELVNTGVFFAWNSPFVAVNTAFSQGVAINTYNHQWQPLPLEDAGQILQRNFFVNVPPAQTEAHVEANATDEPRRGRGRRVKKGGRQKNGGLMKHLRLVA